MWCKSSLVSEDILELPSTSSWNPWWWFWVMQSSNASLVFIVLCAILNIPSPILSSLVSGWEGNDSLSKAWLFLQLILSKASCCCLTKADSHLISWPLAYISSPFLRCIWKSIDTWVICTNPSLICKVLFHLFKNFSFFRLVRYFALSVSLSQSTKHGKTYVSLHAFLNFIDWKGLKCTSLSRYFISLVWLHHQRVKSGWYLDWLSLLW